MNPARLLFLLVSLPLLLGGCGIEEPVADVKTEEPLAETKPKPEGVNYDELDRRGEFPNFIFFIKGSDTPHTGKAYALHPNGQKWIENNFKGGKRDGLEVMWYENGQKQVETNLKDDKANGLHLEWYSNGQKRNEGNYKHGKLDGLDVSWHENGQKGYEENHKEGKLISGKYWNSKGEPVDTIEEAQK